MNGNIERGVVKSGSNGRYTVASLDREGIETLPIIVLKNETYTEGDRVYFFSFPDGTGAILCRMID